MFNRHAKFGLKIPDRLGKMSENFSGGGLTDTVCLSVGVQLADYSTATAAFVMDCILLEFCVPCMTGN